MIKFKAVKSNGYENIFHKVHCLENMIYFNPQFNNFENDQSITVMMLCKL